MSRKPCPWAAPDRWDYVVVDPACAGSMSRTVQNWRLVWTGTASAVLGKVAGAMPGGSHGIGISAATGKGYTDDGAAGVAVPFDLKTFKAGTPIKAKDADGIAFDPTSGHVFVVDGDSEKLTVIDPKTDSAIATIDVGGGLEYAVAGNPAAKSMSMAQEKKEIVRIDTTTNKVDARWPIPDCTSPHGLAIDIAGHRLFPTCLNNVMMVLNTDSGKIVAKLPHQRGRHGLARPSIPQPQAVQLQQ